MALLDIDSSGRRGVELPKVKSTYWPHQINLERLRRSRLDWRLLCPGPMVDEPAVGLDRLRVSIDVLPVHVPAFARALPRPLLLPIFASLIPQMVVPYADAAALMLANLDRGNAMSRHRVGLALPVGMRGRKSRGRPRPIPRQSKSYEQRYDHRLLASRAGTLRQPSADPFGSDGHHPTCRSRSRIGPSERKIGR